MIDFAVMVPRLFQLLIFMTCGSPLHNDSSLGQVTCFSQWGKRKMDTSREFKTAACWDLPSSVAFRCLSYHINKSRIARWIRKDIWPS